MGRVGTVGERRTDGAVVEGQAGGGGVQSPSAFLLPGKTCVCEERKTALMKVLNKQVFVERLLCARRRARCSSSAATEAKLWAHVGSAVLQELSAAVNLCVWVFV